MDVNTEEFGDTIPKRIQFWGNNESSAPAFIFWGPTGKFVLSREDVLELSSKFAYRINQRGIKVGDVVCIILPNSPERVVVQLGTQLAGAIPMNGQLLRADGKDLVESVKKAQCKMLVVDPEVVDGAWTICKQHNQVCKTHDDHAEIESERMPALTMVEFCRSHKPEMHFLGSLQKEKKLVLYTDKSSDIAQLFTTSGSSGFTKIVAHTHKSMLTMSRILNGYTQTKQMEKYCTCAPLGWIGGFPSNFLHSGCPRVLFDDSNGNIPDRIRLLWTMISSEDVHTATLMPIHYMAIYDMEDLWKASGFKLKRLVSGGQPMKKQNLRVIGFLTESLFSLYGSTELGSITGINLLAKDVDDFQDSTTGYPLDGVEIRIVDANFEDVETGSRGEILVRSDTLCKEYVGESGSSFLENDWFRTDDVGYRKADGNLVVEGRNSDAIMHGGYILYPYWLEQKLLECPGVKEVVVVPVPDPVVHHEICACVRQQEGATVTEECVVEFCKSEMDVDISHSMKMIPKYVLVFEAYPLTNTFKLDRRKTAKIAQDRLHL